MPPLRSTSTEPLIDALVADPERAYRFLVEESSDILAIHQPDGTLRWISPAVERVLGWTAEERLSLNLQLIHQDDLPAVVEARHRLLEGAPSVTVRLRLKHVDGSFRWADSTARAVRAPDGSIDALTIITRDVNEQVEAEEALESSLSFYRLLADHASDVILVVGPQGALEWVSPAATRTFGWDPGAVAGARDADFIHPDDREQFEEEVQRQEVAHSAGVLNVRVLCGDGSYRWTEVAWRVTVTTSDAKRTRVVRLRDIQAEMEAREALTRSEERFRTAMDSAPTGMAVVSLDRGFLEVNPALCQMLDRDEEWLLSRRIVDVIDAADDALDLRTRAAILSGHEDALTHEQRLIRADGSIVWVDHSIGLLRDDDGIPRGYVSQFVNVTEAREAREELRFMATHDSLTRLVNRPELLAQMDRLLARSPRTGLNIAALFVDLDRLKAINDAYGHAVGDSVIIEVAARLRSQVRSGDLVARLGGDEFVVLLPAIHSIEDADAIAGKIHAVVASPMSVGDETLTVTVSIGVALAEAGQRAERILELADRALYEAKRSGRARTVRFSPSAP